MCGSTLTVKGGMTSVVKNYLNYDKWEDVKIKYIPTHTDCNKYLLILFFACAYMRILFLVLFSKIDIAHLHTAEKGSFYRKAFLVKTLKKLGVKTIMHHHAAEFEEFYESSSSKQKKYISEVLELTDVNIVLSKRLIPMIINKAPNASVKVLYNAVNTYAVNPYNKNAKNILMLGRLGKRKGVYDLITSIKEIDNKIDKDIKFYLCGDGEVEEVNTLINTLGLSHRIAHIGWIDSELKNKFMSNTMINILPSYNEGLPMTILETMAYGIPNISTNIASIPEVIDNKTTGLLIKPGDTNMLSENMLRLIENKDLRASISCESYHIISQQFSLDNNIIMLKEMYLNI